MKYTKLSYRIKGRDMFHTQKNLYFQDAEKGTAAYHIITDLLQDLYQNNLIIDFSIDFGFTEDIK